MEENSKKKKSIKEMNVKRKYMNNEQCDAVTEQNGDD